MSDRANLLLTLFLVTLLFTIGSPSDARSSTEFPIVYEDMSYKSAEAPMMSFYDEATLRSSYGVRGANFQSFGRKASLERCSFGDILCIVDGSISDIPIVISTQPELSKSMLYQAGYVMSDLSKNTGACREYRIQRRDAKSREQIEYVFCQSIGVTRIRADSGKVGSARFYELRSYKGLGAENVDKFKF